MIDRQGVQQRWGADGSKRDERGRRVFAAREARAAGTGGIAATSEITGSARSTIGRGPKELDMPSPSQGRVRRDGGGRGGGRARHLGRYQEERPCGCLQEWRQ